MAGQARQEYTSGGDAASVETPYVDLEQNALAEARPRNTTVRNISWSGVTVTVKDRVTKKQKTIVDNVEGFVEAGQSSLRTHLPPPPTIHFSAPGMSGTVHA